MVLFNILMVPAVVMILRVWAMYNRSTIILRTLLAFVFLEIIFIVFITAIDSDPKYMPGM